MFIKIIAWGSLFWKHLWNRFVCFFFVSSLIIVGAIFSRLYLISLRFDFGIMFVVAAAQIATLAAKGEDSFSLDSG